MNIKLHTLKLMKQWELFQFTFDMIEFAHKQEEGMPQTYADKLDELNAAFDIYDKELAQDRMPTPHQLLKADEDRDYAIRKLYQLIRYYSDYRFDAAKEDAAKALKTIFKSYGTGSFISRQAQDVQTAMIGYLLKELARDKEQQYIATLNLTEVVLALDTNNQIFEREQMARRKMEARYVTGVVKDARAELQKQIVEFATLINALALLDGEEKYAELKLIFNAMLKKYVTAAQQRTKKKEGDASSDIS